MTWVIIDPMERIKVVIATSPVGWKYIQSHSPLNHVPVGPFISSEQAENVKLPDMGRDFEIVPVLVTGEEDQPDVKLLLQALRRMGMETICVESPTYAAALMSGGCLDEYFINYSMVFAGGTLSPGAVFLFACRDHPHAELVSVGIHRQNFLYTRQMLCYDAKP